MTVVLKRLLWIILAIALLIVGNKINDSLLGYWQDVIQRCGIAIIMAVSLNIVNGLTGQFAIGHAGFMAVGAYTGASVTYEVGQHYTHTAVPGFGLVLLAMLAGGLMAALFGLIVGVPSLRLRGDYLAIVTLGFGEIIRVLLENTDDITPALHFMGGATGFSDAPSLAQSPLLFPLIFGTALTVIVLSRNLKFSAHGLAFLAIREDEIAADAMGVNTTRIKVTAFVLSAFFAGVGGVIFAHARLIKPDMFGFILSMNFVVMIVLGGTGSITGASLAAVVLTLLPEFLKPVKDRIHFTDEYLQVIYALSLVILMIVRPSGVFGTGEITLAGFKRLFRRGVSTSVDGDDSNEGMSAEALKVSDQKQSALPVQPSAVELGLMDREVILDLADVTRRFGGLTAVGDVNIQLREGELVGLIGPNGAGKTTLFNLLTGVYEPSAGQMDFCGRALAGLRPYAIDRRLLRLAWDSALFVIGGWVVGTILSSALVPFAVTAEAVRQQSIIRWLIVAVAFGWSVLSAPRRRQNLPGLKPYQFAQRGISRTFQNIRLFGDLTALENVRIGTYLRRRTNIFDALFRTARLDREERQNITHARDLLTRFNLSRVENEKAKNLPYGDQRRLEIVRALATDPKLLLLDEPAAGMNPQEKHALMGLIRQVRDDFGLTILLIEHDMRLVMGICERIYVLDYGRVIAEGTPQEIRSNPKVIAAYLGEEAENSGDEGAVLRTGANASASVVGMKEEGTE